MWLCLRLWAVVLEDLFPSVCAFSSDWGICLDVICEKGKREDES